MRFTLNGSPADVDAHPMKRLLDVLRDECGLTGTKEGCGEGECGACTVLVDDMLVVSCLVPFAQVAGSHVRTIEGLGTDHALQHHFMNEAGAQCGICTPGMLIAARAFLDSAEEPTEDGIREAIAGNLCRCTGYTKIIEAIAIAAGRPQIPDL